MPKIEITTVAYTVSADYLATVGADFNAAAIDDAVLARLNRLVPMGVVVHRNGKVFADADVAERARRIDWAGLLKQIDLDQILADNGR